MKKLIFLLLALTSFFANAQKSFTVYFKSDVSKLNSTSQQVLDTIRNILTVDPACSVELFGRADADGDTIHNLNLSRARINSVYDYLQYQLPNDVDKNPLGELSPIVPNTNESNKQENRSVIINLINCSADLNTIEGTERIIDQKFGAPLSTFEFESKENITLKTRNNSYIKIPPFTFCDKRGRVINGEVKFEIREFLSYPEMIFSGMNMVATDGLLASDGFFGMQAMKGKDTLQIRDGKNMQIILNNANADTSMKYFRLGKESKSVTVENSKLNSSKKLANKATNNYNGNFRGIELQQWVSDSLSTSTVDTIADFYGGNFNESEIQKWIYEQNKDKKSTVEARQIAFDSQLLYSENLSLLKMDSVKIILQLLSLKENQDLTAQLIINAFNIRDEIKLNRLISRLKIKNIKFGLGDSVTDPNAKAGIYLYKSTTQREIKFSDEVFAGIDFTKTIRLSFEIGNWTSSDFMVDKNNITYTSIIKGGNYTITIPSMSYVNCDRYINTNNTVKLAIDIGEAPKSTAVRLILTDSKTIVSGQVNAEGKLFFPALPNNSKAYLVAYSVWNGEFFYSKKEITTGKVSNLTISVEKAKFEDFQKAVTDI